MKLHNNNTLLLALLFSGVVHGIVLLYQQSDPGDAPVNQLASVTVQVELVSGPTQSNDPQPLTPRNDIEEVIAVKSSRSLHSVEKNPQQKQDMSKAAVRPVVTDADEVSDYVNPQQGQQYSNSGNRADQLGKFVYEAINRQKHYPYVARKQRREGMVRLNFIMHPDGQVTDIAIVQSSQYDILDKAARRAVEAISPFQLAAEYLSMQHKYNVDIDFRLN